MKKVTDKEIWIDNYLKEDLDSVLYNLKNDWDFVIPISGDGRTRVGKSHLGFQIAYYLSYQQNLPFTHEQVVFSGDELRKLAPTLPKGSVIVLDEGRAELDSKKTMHGVSLDLQDYFAECGMYNHVIIVILPDFFELTRTIALNRSEFLINVYIDFEKRKDKTGNNVQKMMRGGYEVYNRAAKRKLYWYGKKNAGEYNSNFKSYYGTFKEKWVIDKEKYEERKLKFLQRTRLDRSSGGDSKNVLRASAAMFLLKEFISLKEISLRFSKLGVKLSSNRISELLTSFSKKIENRQSEKIFETLGESDDDLKQNIEALRSGT